MTGLEIVGVIFGLICVWLTAKNNVWNWPVGIVNIVCFIGLFYQNGLYPDVCLHITYLAMSVYGWFHWGRQKNDLPVTRLSNRAFNRIVPILPVLTLFVGGFFAKYTNASVPYADSAIMVTSLAAQWLMAKKVLESWWFWITVDVMGIILYTYKGLYLTGGLYAVYLILCIIGLRTWTTIKNAQDLSSASSLLSTPVTNI